MGVPENGMVPCRGFVLVDHFAEASGVEASALRSLIEDGSLAGLVSATGAALGLLDDALPTMSDLEALGLSVSSRYEPADLRSVVVANGADEPPDEDGVINDSTWTIGW